MDRRANRTSRRSLAATLAIILGMLAAACGTSGQDLREPDPNLPSPTRATEAPRGTGAASKPQGAPNGVFSLLTNAWSASDSAIPRQYSCDGAGVSPDLSWSNVPAGTAELALVVIDPDADDFVHWIVTGIPPREGSVDRDAVPAGGTERRNSAGQSDWTPPCPPKGSLHRYDFKLLALPNAPDIADDTPPAELVDQLEQAATRTAVLSGTFER